MSLPLNHLPYFQQRIYLNGGNFIKFLKTLVSWSKFLRIFTINGICSNFHFLELKLLFSVLIKNWQVHTVLTVNDVSGKDPLERLPKVSLEGSEGSFQGIFHLHCKPIPVMKTGNSLCTFPSREKPVSITWEPCNDNRFFPVWEKYTGKSLFWPCTGPVRDCSVGYHWRSIVYIGFFMKEHKIYNSV